jgi:glutamate 5-kinase
MSESKTSSSPSAQPSSGSPPDAAAARAQLGAARRIVVKVGSAVLCSGPTQGVDPEVIDRLRDGIAALVRSGREVVVVSSGAIALGVRQLKLSQRPTAIDERQALAAIGQSSLMREWRDALSRRGLHGAQVLLTHGDLADRKRYLNARRAIQAMLRMGAVPVVNENDTVATEELQFGDNDGLSAQVAGLLSAELLVLLSTHDGLFDKNPDAHPDAARVPFVERVTDAVVAMAAEETSRWGTGGMGSKIQAARTAARSGIATVIASGHAPHVLDRVVAGEDVGTLFAPERERLASRKHWIAYSLKPQGTLQVDVGAERALREGGKSLLASGISGAEGRFDVGDAVRVVGASGVEFARGLVAYSAQDVQRIAGRHSDEIEPLLGQSRAAAVIHRDDLVLL